METQQVKMLEELIQARFSQLASAQVSKEQILKLVDETIKQRGPREAIQLDHLQQSNYTQIKNELLEFLDTKVSITLEHLTAST